MRDAPAESRADEAARPQGGGCVILAQGNQLPPADLIAGLFRRGLELRLASSPAMVMVELARRKAQVVVVNEPRTWMQLEELVGAIQQCYPSVPCWGYSTGYGRSRLARAREFVRGESRPDGEAARPRGETPALRPEARELEHAAAAVMTPLSPPELSAEEIEMLLGSTADAGDLREPA